MAKKKSKSAKKKKTVKKAKKKSTVKKKVVKTAATKSAAKKVQGAAGGLKASKEKRLGEVEDYFSNIGVIALTLKNSLSVGDSIHVKGHTTELVQKVESMQIDHEPIHDAKKGDGVGIKVSDKCRKGDEVFKVG